MKRIALALCLAGVTAAAQAGAAEHHRVKAADGLPGRAEAALHWFAAHAGSIPPSTPAAMPAPAAPTARAVMPQTAPQATPQATPHVMPHVVTVAAAPAETPVSAPVTRAIAAPAVVPSEPSHPAHGRSHCNEGEYIISAFYDEGRETASGERFDPAGYTAAHRTLPFGTRLKVINPRTGKAVLVRINDRGPFVKGVTLDLSRAAAKAIGLQGTGAVCMAMM
jgi:rare lipoprotein A